MRFPRRFRALSLFAATVLFAPTFLFAQAAVADMKIAVIDTQRAVMETEDGLRMQATLKKLFDKRQLEIDKRQNELQGEREDIDKQRGVLSQEALGARVEKWQQEVAQVQQVFVDYNKELQKKQNELMQPILQKVLGTVRRIATGEGFAMVIDKQAVPYVRNDLDLTDRAITAYNSGVAEPLTGAAPAAPPQAASPPAAAVPGLPKP
jgi:outer membrane protein